MRKGRDRRRSPLPAFVPALCLPLLCALLFCLMTGCGARNDAAITSLSQLGEPGRKIGVGLNCPEEALVPRDYPEAVVIPYSDAKLAYSDVAGGRLDAFVYERRLMELAILNGTSGVRLLDVTYSTTPVAVGISPVSPIPRLEERLNAFIAELKADGTLEDMYDRWVIRGDETMPDIPQPEAPALRLRVATVGTVEPYTYYVGTELRGYDIELAHRFAAWLGASLEFKIYDFGGVIAAAKSGDVDCIMSDLYYTPEHDDSIPFSDTLFEVENAVMVRDAGADTSAANAAGDGVYTDFSELEHARIGVTTGSVQALQVQERFPECEMYYFTNDVDALNALKANKIDAFALAEALVRYMMTETPELTYIDERLGEGMYVGAVFPKTDSGQALCDEFSEFVRDIRQNGVYDEILDTWFGDDESKRVVPGIDALPATNGTLRMATDTGFAPFVYIKDGEPVGIDVDMAVRFCRAYGYGLEIVPMDFAGIIPAIVTGKVDFACSGVAYTPERAESVLYSEFTYESGSVMAVLRRSDGAAASQTVFDRIGESFAKTFIRENRWKLFVEGIGTTLLITVLSILFGTALGFGVFMLCRNGNPAANAVTRFFVWLVQGMPVVVLLMILYYIIFGRVAISGTAVSVVGFTLVFGAAVYAMIKAGVGTVDKGQTEAAYALGYSDRRAFFRVVLPQALPHFMPAYKGEITALIKATAVVGYVAVQDLTKMGDIVRSRTYEAFFPLIAVAVIYFVLAAILTFFVNKIELRVDPRRRGRESILRGIDAHG